MIRIPIIISIVFALSACSLDAIRAGGDADIGSDTSTSMPDGGAMATGASTDDGIPAGETEDAFSRGESMPEPGTSSGGADVASCFDGVDNDEDSEGFDCTDEDCSGVASCSVGNGELCTFLGVSSLPLAACDDSPVTAACLSDLAEPFGSPSPWIASGALHPGGNDDDSGVLFATPVALRSHRMALRATFQEPTCGAGDPCIDTVAMGVTTQSKAQLESGARVRAQVALSYSSARREISLLLSGSVAGRWGFADRPAEWTLVLRPDGLIDVKNGADSVLTTSMPYTPVDGARVIVYGRSMNRAFPTPNGAALLGLDVETSVCDIPSAWEERDEIDMSVALGGSAVRLDAPAGVTTALGGADERRYLVFREPGDDGLGRFAAAFETSAGPSDYRLAHADNEPILAPDTPLDRGGIADPELFWDGAAWHLYYTAINARGLRSVTRASGATLTALTKDGLAILDPWSYEDIDGFDMPSHVRTETGIDVLVARATESNGAHHLVAFADLDGLWTRISDASTMLDDLTRRDGTPVAGRFDADEIAHPSVVRVGGSYHIYYAGRRGTRWGVGLLATDELLFVRDVTADGPLLTGSGEGFDALGVLEPDVLVESDTVSLFYVGTDGTERALGRVARRAGGSDR